MNTTLLLSIAKASIAVAALAGAIVAWRSRPIEALHAPAEIGEVRLEALGTGTLESDNRVVVAFTVGGRLASLAVDEGAEVRAGQVLAALERDEALDQVAIARASESLATVSIERARADVAKARVALEGADLELKRTVMLVAKGAMSEATLEAAKERQGRAAAELEAAKAALTQAGSGTDVARATTRSKARRIGDSEVTSPFDGVVLQRLHAVGDVLAPGAGILVIASTHKVRARAWIDETALPALREGGEARVVVRSEPNRALRGRVERIGLEADRQTHEVLVDVELLERPRALAFGQRVDVSLLLEGRSGVVRAPLRFCDGGSRTCLVARDGRVQSAQVSVGLVGNEWVEVTSGLAAGEELLAPAESGGTLRVGAVVRPSEAP